jgi:L-fuconolactonase
MRRIDSHHHFWDPNKAHYPWMKGDALAPITRAFEPDDMRPLIKAAGIDATVLVQTRHEIAETHEYLEIAANTDFVAGVVGWVDLTSPHIGDELNELIAGPNGRYLVGIRHLVHDEKDADWIARPDVIAGIGAIGHAGLAYDLLPRERELPACIACIDANPDVRFVVDHIAKPRIGEGAMEPWSERITEIARRPNVWCKLSGMVTEADWVNWKPADLTPYIEKVIALFGEDRVMFGSDWPVCLLASDYETVFVTLRDQIAPMGQTVEEKVFATNAAAFYQLDT